MADIRSPARPTTVERVERALHAALDDLARDGVPMDAIVVALSRISQQVARLRWPFSRPTLVWDTEAAGLARAQVDAKRRALPDRRLCDDA